MHQLSLTISHDNILSAHQGYAKTYKRATAKFFWFKLARDVSKYIQTCMPCQKRKRSGHVITEIGDFTEITRPLQRVGVDLIELTPSHNGNRYALI